TDSLVRAATEAGDALVFAVPSHGLREVAGRVEWGAAGSALLVSAVKGFEVGSGLRPSQIIEAAAGRAAGAVCVLSGPSHAEEVGRGIPTAVVAASLQAAEAERVQAIFHAQRFRVYTHPDPLGVELAGAFKNVIAIACGIADGLGFGDNTRAALITRGLVEMSRLGSALGGRRDTFNGLAGLGDLVVTCTSGYSRNRRLGREIGSGRSLEDIVAGTPQVAEGVNACRVAVALAKERGASIPIMEQVHAVLFGHRDPARAMQELLARGARPEAEGMGPGGRPGVVE
ncbi:MAG: NAD(P)H-dependent glycerol-3-phosphate dehydrogenase, partial [bacterium]